MTFWLSCKQARLCTYLARLAVADVSGGLISSCLYCLNQLLVCCCIVLSLFWVGDPGAQWEWPLVLGETASPPFWADAGDGSVQIGQREASEKESQLPWPSCSARRCVNCFESLLDWVINAYCLYSELGSEGSEYEQLSTPDDSEEAGDDQDFDVDGMLPCSLEEYIQLHAHTCIWP